MRIVSTLYTYITPVKINSTSYIVKDPIITLILPTFTPSNTSFGLIYSLTYSTGISLSPQIFTFNPQTLNLTIYADQNDLKGIYELTLTARYDAPFDISANSNFSVSILDECMKNILIPPVSGIPSMVYRVSDPTMI